MVVRKNTFLIPYPYLFYCTFTDSVSETWGDVSKYGFYVWDPQAMKLIRNETNKTSSKNTSEQDRNETEAQGGDGMNIVDVSVTSRADVMSI